MSEKRAPVRWWVWLALGLVLVVLIVALLAWWRPIYDFVADQEQIRAWVEQLGAWGPVAIVALETAQALMGHSGIRLLVVTGGPAVVRAALDSGKKCITAGPGNPPAVVADTACLKR